MKVYAKYLYFIPDGDKMYSYKTLKNNSMLLLQRLFYRDPANHQTRKNRLLHEHLSQS